MVRPESRAERARRDQDGTRPRQGLHGTGVPRRAGSTDNPDESAPRQGDGPTAAARRMTRGPSRASRRRAGRETVRRREQRKGTTMARHREGTPTQLDLTYDGSWPVAVRPSAKPRCSSARLCVVCGRVRGHLTMERGSRRRPVRLCLRCHHAVMRQRRMARAGLATSEPSRVNGGLIVPRASGLSADALSRRLSRSRRRAQKAARVAIGAG